MCGRRLAAMLTLYTDKGVAPEVNLMKCISCMPPPSVNKAAHSVFETQRYQWPYKWTCAQQQFFQKRLVKTRQK